MDKHPDLDFIVCSSDILAYDALTEAAERGLQVPADIGVMRFSDPTLAA